MFTFEQTVLVLGHENHNVCVIPISQRSCMIQTSETNQPPPGEQVMFARCL